MGRVGRAGESTVGDQHDAFAQAAAHDGRGDRQHLLHAWAAHGALVADDHHVAGAYAPLAHRLEGLALRVEDPCGPLVREVAGAGDLQHSALRGQVASQG